MRQAANSARKKPSTVSRRHTIRGHGARSPEGSIIPSPGQRFRVYATVLTWLALTIVPVGSRAAEAGEYVSSVSQALDALEKGDTKSALTSIDQAMVSNANDPLAHTALAATLLVGGRTDEAAAQFAAARKIDPGCAEAIYGSALIALAKKQSGPAVTLFCEAQTAAPQLDMQGTILYAKLVTGATMQPDESAADDARIAIAAYELTRSAKFAEAEELWKQLAPATVRPGFFERIGCAMTFDKNAPLVFTGNRFDPSFKLAPLGKTKLATISGNVTLQADLSKARTVKLVAFLVDGKLVGLTNQPPFHYPWDTTRASNGVHTIKITGTDALDSVVSEKSLQVVVKNAGADTPQARVTGPDAEKAWSRLWRFIRLKPSAAAVNYNLGLCALRNNRAVSAVEAFERAMAADPDYADTRVQLRRLYNRVSPPGCLYRVPTQRKAIAITFDDGPKPDTAILLDTLKQLRVKSTFFVVGKQVEAYPAILKRMMAEGHDIQNHTYRHLALDFLTKRQIEQEVFGCAATVRSLTGRGTGMLRPPGARRNSRVAEVMGDYGMTTVLWTANCAKLEGTTKEKMTRYVLASAKPGAIILMHNLDRVTLNALPGIVSTLRAKGYTFVTLSELIAGNGG